MTDRERILDRLTKLLAMARSPNAHEAATAGRMAESLMSKHGLTRGDVEAFAPAGLYEKPMGAKGFEAVWKFSLITATARFCGCEAISLNVGASRRKVRLVGDKDSVEQAALLFESLLKTMTDLERLEVSWVSDPTIPIFSSPKEYVDSFRRGATVAIIETMMRMRPSRFGIRKGRRGRASAPPAPTPTAPEPSPAEPARPSWISKIWPFRGSLRELPSAEPRETSSSLVVRVEPAKEKGYEEKVKRKYSPRQVKLDLEDAVDDGAYWRGYQSAKRLVVLPTDSTPSDSPSDASTSQAKSGS